MKRIFGLMPSDEIAKSMEYRDQFDVHIGVDAGCHGWTIRWADASCTFGDVDDTPENNFQKALDVLAEKDFKLTPIKSDGGER